MVLYLFLSFGTDDCIYLNDLTFPNNSTNSISDQRILQRSNIIFCWDGFGRISLFRHLFPDKTVPSGVHENYINEVIQQSIMIFLVVFWIYLLLCIISYASQHALLHAFYFCFFPLIQGGVQNGLPRPQVILPSAALSGAIISFVLGPTELIKVK